MGEAARPRRVGRRILLLVSGTIAALLALEVGYRILDAWRGVTLADHDPAAFLYAPCASGPVYRPGARVELSAGGGHVFEINRLGFRGPEIDVSKPEGRLRIVCLGGSSTAGYLLREEETWPTRLQVLLRERIPDRPVEVINAGVSGYTSHESLVRLASQVIHLDPDWIVVYHGFNDVLGGRRWGDGTTWFLDRPQPKLGPLGSPLLLVLRRRLVERASRGWHDGDAARGPEEALAAYERNLTSMAGIARAHGIGITLVSQASLFQERIHEEARGLLNLPYYEALFPEPVLDGFTTAMERTAAIHSRIAGRGDAGHIDVRLAVPPSGENFRDAIHHTPVGAARTAEAIGRALLPELQAR